MRLWDRGTRADDARWALHKQSASGVVADFRNGPFAGSRVTAALADAWHEGLFSCPPEVTGSALMLLVRDCATTNTLSWGSWLYTLNDAPSRHWSVTREDAFLAARTIRNAPDNWQAGWALTVVGAMLNRAVGDTTVTDSEAHVLRDLIESVESRRAPASSDRTTVRTRLLRLLPADDPSVGPLPMAPADGWSASVLPALRSHHDRAQVTALLRHLNQANGSKPTAKWLAANAELATDGQVVAILQLLLEQLVSAEPITRPTRYGVNVPVVVDELNTDIARAIVWATIPVREPWVLATLHRLAVRGIRSSALVGWMSGDKIPNACILVLGRIGTPGAIAALQQLADSTKNNGFRKRIAAALSEAATAAGLTPGQLIEQTIPTGGLNVDSTMTLTTKELTARIVLEPLLKVGVTWLIGTEWSTQPDSTADKQGVDAVKRAVKELKILVASERRRLESLFASDRAWEVTEWRKYYLDHPITGRIARRLIWVFDDGAATTGIPMERTALRTLDGDVALPTTGTVRLWHPAIASTDEVSAWRDALLRAEFVQPFKQAFREVYILTPAERQTDTYSNRFASHVLHYQQLYALFKERFWVANYLGPYDGGYEGHARHEFPDAGFGVVFEHFQVDAEQGEFRTALATTDRVWFFRIGDRARQPVSIAEVPPLVFSEAMRDVDLFVGVTSIALDPTWADRGADAHYGYWHSTSFGALTATAEVRRDILGSLLPKLNIANRVELGDRFVRVRGNRATYKIHLGSANVLIEPDDRYLCIVPSSNARTNRIMLPFEGDQVLAVILSKVPLLASDDKITDASILFQLERRTSIA